MHAIDVPLLFGISLVNIFADGMILMEPHIDPIWSLLVTVISEYMVKLDLLLGLQSYWDAETNNDERQDSCQRTLRPRVEKCVASLPNAKVPVSVTTSSDGLI